MKRNVGKFDLAIRLIVAATLVLLVLTKVITGAWIAVSAVLMIILVLTGLVGFCPLYGVFGLNTRNIKKIA